MPDAITLGELLIDFVSTTIDVPLGDCPAFVKAPGGAPANVAVGLAKLGISAGFIGKVGDDPFGHFLMRILSREGVDTSHLKLDKKARTTLAFVANRSDGRKEITFHRNPGADQMLTPEDVDRDYLSTAKLFHFGSVSLSHSPSREATLYAAELAKELGLLVSYDPNWRPPLWDDYEDAKRMIWHAMRFADIVKLAEEEWEFVTGTESLEDGARKILDVGAKFVVVTMGEKGAWFTNGSISSLVEPFEVDVVDPLGAGDGFVAALLAQLVNRKAEEITGDELYKIVRIANAAGALTCTRMGVIPALPKKEELNSFLEERRTNLCLP
ncbi:MAG: PfkB family carbohydrate kinase [Armatimonadota bacterium]|nr:PfkB family carbohydrate kinase [Armatimonadota bacterium]MCX7777949.1 PfkB family carbohydrate kinase [Armatimonadota bacterium]MDW8025294.1 PfkB family carbohydrate kinase [Armatimonadota bacterium]